MRFVGIARRRLPYVEPDRSFTMNGTLPLIPQRPDRILTIATWLVALVGATELAAVGLYYGNKARAAYVATHPSVTTTAAARATAAPQAPAAASPAVAASP